MARTKRSEKKSFANRKKKKGKIALSLCLCVLFLLCTVMTSFAWYDFNQSKTNVFRGTADNVTVVLYLIEKDANGVIQADPVVPIMNAQFQLYRIEDDGTETIISGGPWYTDADGKIVFDGRDGRHPRLQPGKYVFVETSPSFGYTYDKDEDDKFITRYEFEVTQADALSGQTVTVPAYNRRGSGTLAVKKTVKGNAPADAEFTFTVVFSNGRTYSYSVDGGDETAVSSGGTLTLKHGQTALFEDIPIGVQYHITETAHPDYTISATGHQGNISDAGSVASFVNTYQPQGRGSLTVSKEVKGDGADTDKEFEFTAQIGGETVDFTLKNGEEKEFLDLPLGTEYTVTEKPADGYIATVTQFAGTITGAEEVILPFVNVYEPDPDGKVGSLTVNKEVVGEGADADKVFTFEVTFEGEGAPQPSTQTFTLKAGQSKVFDDLPAGVTYTVRETDAAGYLPELTTVTGVIAPEETAVVTFKNRVPEEKGKLSVTKLLAGDYPDARKEFAFTLMLDGKEALTFTLAHGETKEFDVPQGSLYEVIEKDYFDDGYQQTVTGGFGTVDGEEIKVVVTNTFIGDPVLDIEGEKKWELQGQSDTVLPEFITVWLKNGDTVVFEQVVRPDANGDWKYTFTVPKLDADGKRIKYTVEEKPVAYFVATYDGYDITNTYVAPIKADPPVITKVVQGENAPDTRFAFIIEGPDGAPMPEGSVGNVKTVYITGGGEVEFGNILFTTPGTYRYTIREKNDNATGWTYDDAEYMLSFTVTEADGRLVVSPPAIERNGETAQRIEFTNSYTEPPPTEVTVAGKKTWDHGDNPVTGQPQSIVLYVYGDGQLVVQWQVSAQDNWEYSFELPKFAADGSEIVYTVDEKDVDGYTKRINGYDIINTYVGVPGDPFTPPSPGTGDDSELTKWFITMIVSGSVLIIISAVRLKRSKRRRFVR